MGWRKRRDKPVSDRKVDTPLARSEELVVEEVDDGLLIYDLKTDQAHSLSPSAARVWRCCDGQTTVAALSSDAGVDADTTERALAELEACRLLDATSGRQAGSTRREAGAKLAKLGAAAAAAPLIASIAAPAASMATVGCSLAPCRDPTDPQGLGNFTACRGSGCICCFLAGFTTGQGGCTVDVTTGNHHGCCVPGSMCV